MDENSADCRGDDGDDNTCAIDGCDAGDDASDHDDDDIETFVSCP